MGRVPTMNLATSDSATSNRKSIKCTVPSALPLSLTDAAITRPALVTAKTPNRRDFSLPASTATNAFQGNYTFLMAGSTNAADSPAGLSAATVSVDSRANLTLNGSLADGAALSQSTTVGAGGRWPLFVSLYGGKGVFTGWMGLNPDVSTLSATNAAWTKLPVTNDRYYSNGFSVVSPTLVARYMAPTNSQRPVSWTNALAIVGGGNLSGLLTNQVTFTNNQLRAVGGGISNLTLTISAGDGTFTGSFLPPGSRTTANIKGVLVETNNTTLDSGGWFLGTNQSGFIRLQPQ